MRDHSQSEGDRGGSRSGGGDDRPRDQSRRGDGDGPRRDGSGPDTRFLQLEMSQVMYAEAEAVARPAFRELLLEAAKDRFRERFGQEITALARLAVDELLKDVHASFEIEARVQQFSEERRPPKERLSEVFAARRTRSEAPRGPDAPRRARRKR